MPIRYINSVKAVAAIMQHQTIQWLDISGMRDFLGAAVKRACGGRIGSSSSFNGRMDSRHKNTEY